VHIWSCDGGIPRKTAAVRRPPLTCCFLMELRGFAPLTPRPVLHGLQAAQLSVDDRANQAGTRALPAAKGGGESRRHHGVAHAPGRGDARAGGFGCSRLRRRAVRSPSPTWANPEPTAPRESPPVGPGRPARTSPRRRSGCQVPGSHRPSRTSAGQVADLEPVAFCAAQAGPRQPSSHISGITWAEVAHGPWAVRSDKAFRRYTTDRNSDALKERCPGYWPAG
jgi:hypothetical protein